MKKLEKDQEKKSNPTTNPPQNHPFCDLVPHPVRIKNTLLPIVDCVRKRQKIISKADIYIDIGLIYPSTSYSV